MNCYLGVYPVSHIKHWYRLLDRVPLAGDGWRRSARHARVKRGRFGKITIANGDPLNPDLSYMGEENYLNLNLAFIFYQIKKKKQKKKS